jgi:hypothetical protein
MELQWQEQFAVVAQCVYTVIWDYNEKRTEIIDHLLENRTISGPRARNWQSSSDTKAYALELRIRVIQDILSTLVLNDPHDLSNTKRPSCTGPPFLQCFRLWWVKSSQCKAKCQVSTKSTPSIALRWSKQSMEDAVTQLEAYLLLEMEKEHEQKQVGEHAEHGLGEARFTCMKSLLDRRKENSV